MIVIIIEGIKFKLISIVISGTVKTSPCSKAEGAFHKCKFFLQSFTNNGDISIWEKYSQAGYTTDKQTN